MKKLVSLILSAAVLLGIMPSALAEYTDLSSTSDYYLSALRLQDLGIINGYDDGSFRPDSRITRAEFTKTVVCMMDKDDEARAAASVSGFFDVPTGGWAAPYINYAVGKDILSGYSDGSFGPERTISFAEALTILLRTLGYDEASVGYYWPNNYMDAASALGITAGMDYATDAQLTRATAAILTDRALFTKPAKSVSQDADTYIETIGYTVLDDALILDRDSSSNNISILAGNLKLNNASTYIGKTQMAVETGDIYGHAVIDKNGYLATVKEYGTDAGIYSMTVIVNRLTGNTIEYTTLSGASGSYRADDSFVTYYDNSKMTFSGAKTHITNGADVTFYGNSYGSWNIAVIGASNDVDPVLASHAYTSSDVTFEGKTINKNNLIVYRDGEAAMLSDIHSNDVVYYNEKTNTMDVYSKKVTGVYYAAYPSKAYVESVTVSGKSYDIGYASARTKLDASQGAFNIGDKVTLLLGKNDEIAFVTDNASSLDYFEYGVLLSSSTRIAEEGVNEGSSEFVASMFMADGEVHDIVTDKLYKDNAGDFMRISYSGGKATLTSQRMTNRANYAGNIDFEARTIGGRYLLKDAAIIQRVSETDAQVANCELLDFDMINAKEIDESQILNVVTANSFGDIAILYVKNLENSYQYGVITGFERSGNETVGYTTNGYKIFSGGAQSSYMLGDAGRISTSLNSGVGFRVENGSLSKIIPLVKLDTASAVEAVEGSRIKLKGTIYKMADTVEIIDITSQSNMRSLTIDELADTNNVSQVTIYSDKSISNGGVVRLITISTSK